MENLTNIMLNSKSSILNIIPPIKTLSIKRDFSQLIEVHESIHLGRQNYVERERERGHGFIIFLIKA